MTIEAYYDSPKMLHEGPLGVHSILFGAPERDIVDKEHGAIFAWLATSVTGSHANGLSLTTSTRNRYRRRAPGRLLD